MNAVRARRQAGFTVLEVLITLAILGVFLVAVTTTQSSTLQTSSQQSGLANRLRDLQDAGGYVADRLRQSILVSTDLSVNGAACQITASGAGAPCFAVLASDMRQVGSTPQYQPNVYMYLAYRLVPRSNVSTAEKADDTWADANTFALVEYRSTICAPTASVTCSPGTVPTTIPASIANMTANVLLDFITLDAVGGGTFTPFAYDAASKQFTLTLRQEQLEFGRSMYTPSNDAYTITVQRRN